MSTWRLVGNVWTHSVARSGDRGWLLKYGWR